MYYFNVVLDVPVNIEYTYSYFEILVIGQRVLVEFGRQKKIAFITAIDVPIKIALEKIKSIDKVFPEILSKDMLNIIQFAARYYHYPLGQTLFNIIPTLLRKNNIIQAIKFNYVSLTGLKPIKIKSQKHQALYLALQQNDVSLTHTKKIVGSSKIVEQWLEQGIIKLKDEIKFVDFHSNIKLNDEQLATVESITHNIDKYYPAIIHGVTGSGKTEVYLKLIEKVLLQKKQALVLVPEINLTPQLLQRFELYFPGLNIYILNSSINEKERYNIYINAELGKLQVIIGTRLAVFTPFSKLGIIIIDEEHDSSFKQNDSLRYNARDLAIYRANYYKIPIILGSATPSLESLYNYTIKKYKLYQLSKRAVANAALPQVKIIDLNTHLVNDCLTDKVIQEINKRLLKKELTIVFINRRGYAPIISCYTCGWIGKCNNCSSNLVYHKAYKSLRCHYCAVIAKIPDVCPKCGSYHLHSIGHGTQKIEEVLASSFTQAKIMRIDQDSVGSAVAWQKLYAKINKNEVDILVGTQMLAKGHDFANLTLVVGLNIDSGLYSYDFRATENLFAQLMQVSGRSGRGDKPGEVLLQTNYPRHELYYYLIKHDFNQYAKILLKQRKELNLPPYSHYVMFKASSKYIKDVMLYLNNVYNLMLKHKDEDVVVNPPIPSLMLRLQQKERGQILIQGFNRNKIHEFLDNIQAQIYKIKARYGLTWFIDVDPIEI